VAKRYSLREVVSWCLFDFANSSYSAVIASAIFPVFYVSYVVEGPTGLGDLWWGRAISISVFLVVISSPFMGYLADKKLNRRSLLASYTLICIAAVSLLSTLEKGEILKGFLLILIANTMMEGGLVFYNSFIPHIVPRDYYGRISAWGFALGYIGSALSLILALPLVSREKFEVIWILVAFFYGIFSLPCLIFMPKESIKTVSDPSQNKFFHDLFTSFLLIFKDKQTRRFLLSYFFYEDAVNTVIIFASIYASSTLGFAYKELIVLYLVVQTTAFIGSIVISKPLDQLGPKVFILGNLIAWTLVTTCSAFVSHKNHFWILASFAGLCLGAIQAASRAMYVSFIPERREGEYFGVYSMVGKSSAILGPILFGEVSFLFGSQRPAVFAVTFLFLMGLVFLLGVKPVSKKF